MSQQSKPRDSFGFAQSSVAYACTVGGWLARHMFFVFLLWSLWLVLEYVVFGPASFVRLWDNADSQVPARIGLAKMFLDGHFSSWSPQWAAGVDVLASGFNPLADILLYILAPGWLAHGLFTWLQRFVAGYFSYRLLRDSLGVGTLPAFCGGLFYSLFAQFIVEWVDLAGFTVDDTLIIPGIPLVLWALGRIDLGKAYRPYFYFAGLGVLVSITSYFYQTLFFFPLIFYWFWIVTPKPSSGGCTYWRPPGQKAQLRQPPA